MGAAEVSESSAVESVRSEGEVEAEAETESNGEEAREEAEADDG